MSLYGALNIGVAGLAANAQALSATSANIANVNTVGYKTQTANFETFLNVPGQVATAGAGVSSVISQDVTTQGLPTATSSPTDLSISGNGFFVVASNSSASAQQEFTRAGSFTPDGLAQMNGNAYIATKGSGTANINLANSGGAGGIASQSLEASTVDLASEFTNLITTQRAYSASARIVTTADQMLQQLEQLPTN